VTDDATGRDPLPRYARHLTWWLAVLGTSTVVAWLVLWALAGLPGVRGPWEPSLSVEITKVALAVTAGVGGVVLLVSRYQRQQVSERAAEDGRVDARERRVTEIYTRAVEQLGHESAAVRLGGIYALDRLGRRHAEYRQVVVDVWCAYLRMPVEVAAEPGKAIAPMGADSGEAGSGGGRVFPAGEREVRLSVQRLIAERLRGGEEDGDVYWAPLDVDLTGAVLLNPDFTACRFGGAVFDDAVVSGMAFFDGAVFEGHVGLANVDFAATARFRQASFEGATFISGEGYELRLDLTGATVDRSALFVDLPGWRLADAREEGGRWARFVHEDDTEDDASAADLP